MAPLSHDETPEVVYAQLFVQGLTGALCTQNETKPKGHLGAQIMTRNIRIMRPEAVNLEIGVIANLVHTTQLHNPTPS